MANELRGTAQLIAQLNEFGTKLSARELRGVVKYAIEPALHLARQMIPEGTVFHKLYNGKVVAPGYARSTLQVKVSFSKRLGTATARLGVAKDAFYAVQFIELGTYKYPASPWLVPAFTQTESEQLARLRLELEKRIDKIVKRKAAGKKL